MYLNKISMYFLGLAYRIYKEYESVIKVINRQYLQKYDAYR